LVAGAVLLAAATRFRPAGLKLVHWRSAAVAGGLLFVGGNGLLSWAEQGIDSGIAALVLATIPIWIVVLQSMIRRRAPGLKITCGIFLGFAGVVILVFPWRAANVLLQEPLGFVALLCAALSWAGGTLYARRAPLPDDVGVSTALQLLLGGVLLILIGVAAGEVGRLDLQSFTARSILSMVYLIVFGSLIAFSAFVWLLRVTDPALVGTYAFVNPVIAVILGCLVGGERFEAATVLAGAVIVAGVVLIHRSANRPAVSNTRLRRFPRDGK
jgi:drug/metabolite transporter (DMT)-like permease